MSTRVEGATVLVTVTAHATLSAGPVHLALSAREGPAPGTWRYNLGDTTNSRIQYGRIAGISGHMDVLRYAAGVSKDAFEPGTTEEAYSNNSPMTTLTGNRVRHRRTQDHGQQVWSHCSVRRVLHNNRYNSVPSHSTRRFAMVSISSSQSLNMD